MLACQRHDSRSLWLRGSLDAVKEPTSDKDYGWNPNRLLQAMETSVPSINKGTSDLIKLSSRGRNCIITYRHMHQMRAPEKGYFGI